MPESELLRFLAQVRADPALRQMIAGGLAADEVSLLAQERGFLVSGTEILGFHGQSGEGPGVEAGGAPTCVAQMIGSTQDRVRRSPWRAST